MVDKGVNLRENIVKSLDKAEQRGEIQGVTVLNIIKLLNLPEGNLSLLTLESVATEMYEALLAFDEYTKTNYPANIRLKQIAVEKMDAILDKVRVNKLG